MARKKKAGFYVEADGRHVYKTTEEYKGVVWTCKGTSYENDDMALAAWKRNREKRIDAIEKELAGKQEKADVKTGKIRLSVDLPTWYDTYKRHSRSHGRPRSARTVQTDEDTIKQIVMVLGDMLVCDIDSDTLQRYFLRLVQRGKAQSTIRKRWHMLAMFFCYKYPDGGNPMARCTMPDSAKQACTVLVRDEDEDEPEGKLAYTSAEQHRLAVELAKPYNIHSGWHTADRGYSCGAPLIVGMYEFLRAGEIVELRVKDVMWNDTGNGGMIWVRRQYDEVHKLVTSPKYNSKRKVPIMAECVEILKMACAGKKANDLLFTSGHIYNPDKLAHEGRILRGRLRDNLNTACDRVGLQRHTIHDLRHDGISRLVDMGVQPQSVQRWAGHKSLNVTLDKYYRHNGLENEADLALVSGI